MPPCLPLAYIAFNARSALQNQYQYFTKYCTAEASNGKGSVHSGKGRGILRHLSSWWRRAPSEGLMLGAGVDEALVRGLADEVQGFSGREVCLVLFDFWLVLALRSRFSSCVVSHYNSFMCKRLSRSSSEAHTLRCRRCALEHANPPPPYLEQPMMLSIL